MTTILRWSARILGILFLFLIAAFAIGEGVPNPFHASLPENLLGLAIVIMIKGALPVT